jgi:putative transposase
MLSHQSQLHLKVWALLKLIYLAHNNISQKWTMPLSNWGITTQKLAIWFRDPMVLDLN